MNNIFDMLNQFNSPHAIVEKVMNNSEFMRNPIAKNTIEMMKKGDSKGLEETARNLLKEQGLNPDDVYSQVRQRFGK